MLCTLLLPELLLPRAVHDVAYQDLPLPALEQLLSRADRTTLPAQSYEAWLCQAFGVAPQPDWPVAPLTLVADGGDAANGYWLRADPVHLQVTRDRMLLSDAGLLAIRPDEAAMLVAALNAYITDDTQEFLAPHPERWYLRLPGHPQIATRTLFEALGKDINPLLPAGPEALKWHRMTNEIQMLLHAHAVNEARDERGEPTINSIWLWGGGVWPEVSSGGFHAVWSADPLAHGLAQGAGLSAAQAPDTAAQWLEQMAQNGGEHHHLIVFDQLMLPARHGDLAPWRERLAGLERAWFAPLLHALRERRLTRITLIVIGTDHCLRFDVSSYGLLRFWRGCPHLPSYAPRHET